MEFLLVLILAPVVLIGLWLLSAKIQDGIEENKRANDPIYQNYLKEDLKMDNLLLILI